MKRIIDDYYLTFNFKNLIENQYPINIKFPNPNRGRKLIDVYDSMAGQVIEEIFEFNNEYTDVGVNLNDIFVLDKKKYTFEEAMKALKKGDIIESCYSGKNYMMSPREGETVKYFDTEYNEWMTEYHMFSHNEIFGDWYINE